MGYLGNFYGMISYNIKKSSKIRLILSNKDMIKITAKYFLWFLGEIHITNRDICGTQDSIASKK